MLAGWGKAREGVYEDRLKLRAFQRTRRRPSRLPWRPGWRTCPASWPVVWNSLLWDVLGERCLACGTCNLVCPTCYCFDVRDEVALSLDEGERYPRVG